jgi:streptogramin lyase
LLAFGLTAATAALLVVLMSLPRGPVDPGGPRIGATPPPAVAVEPLVLTSLDGPPFEPVAAIQHGGSVWMTTLGGQVHRLDASTGLRTGGSELPGNACGPLTIAAGYLWAPSCATGPGENGRPAFLTQIDLDSGEDVRTISTPAGGGLQVAGLGDAVWIIADAEGGMVRSLDPATGTMGVERSAGTAVTHIVGDGGVLWLSAPDASAILRLDPGSDAAPVPVPVEGTPTVLLATSEGIWAGVHGAKEVVRIDPERTAVDVVVPLSDNAVQLDATGTALWVLTRSDFLRVDPQLGDVTRRIAVGEHAVSFAPQFVGPTYAMAAGEDLWFIPPRGDMLRIRAD